MRARYALVLFAFAVAVSGCGGDDDEAAVPAWVNDAKAQVQGIPEGDPEAFDYKGTKVWVLEASGDLRGVVFAEDCGNLAVYQADSEFNVTGCVERGGGGFQPIR